MALIHAEDGETQSALDELTTLRQEVPVHSRPCNRRTIAKAVLSLPPQPNDHFTKIFTCFSSLGSCINHS